MVGSTRCNFKDTKTQPFLFHSLFSFPQETNQSKSIKTIGGGFNPFEQYQSNPIISPQIRGENKTSLKPPPRKSMSQVTQTSVKLFTPLTPLVHQKWCRFGVCRLHPVGEQVTMIALIPVREGEYPGFFWG